MLDLDARYDWWVTSLRLWTLVAVLSDKPLVCAYIHNLKTTGYMAFQQIKWLLYNRTHSLCGLELQERSNWKLRLQTRIGRSLIHTCVHILQAHIYIAICCTTTQDNRNPCTLCILHTKWQLDCQQCILLQERSWLGTLHISVSFRFMVYAILPYILHYQFAGNSKKNEHKLGVKNFT